ncbi:MAG: DNA cytosine methyltransferase [Ignavibacteria bacterium]|nr:DNA cytosine methyltransferase [Ignavibacteria bacterium]
MKNKHLINTYVSFFSGAGIGCYGFLLEGFKCIATVELLEKRLKFQRYNDKCTYESGYICGDLKEDNVKTKLLNEIDYWKNNYSIKDIDVVIATPPCQGMSVANHKKKDEKSRNSLVTESIRFVKDHKPKFFIFENVRTFLKTICTDIDGKDKKIKDAIELNLAGEYHIHYEYLNFKNYGNNSSRTRTLVIGTRKNLEEITPYAIFPDYTKEKTLEEVIGDLPELNEMGAIDPTDIYHNFRPYAPKMLEWIKDIKEGESAFDNNDIKKIPHQIIDGLILYNTNKNSDKYTRCYWDKVGPCIHTRNDILASQNTIHPRDNRVFSIRELMKMMTIPDTFKWTDISEKDLNKLPYDLKRKFLSKEEMNIRHSIGEAVPTNIFRQIANKIKTVLNETSINLPQVNKIIEKENLKSNEAIYNFVKINLNKLNYSTLSKIVETSNALKTDNAAYYTRQDICYSIIKDLPSPDNYDNLKILEPSIGVGNFLPLLITKYREVKNVTIDVVDIDEFAIKIVGLLVKKLNIPENIKINYINNDFLLHEFNHSYDIVVGNPPFKKFNSDKELLNRYKSNVVNKDTNNLYSFFIEKCLQLGDIVSLVVPKSLINSPEYNKTREILSKLKFNKIIDYGEKAFKGVLIETISFIIENKPLPANNSIEIESYILNNISIKRQDYIFSSNYPYWLIYRDDYFDSVSQKLNFNIYKSYRDRQITKKITKPKADIRVLKSRNIGSNKIIDIDGYDCYVNYTSNLDVLKFINNKEAVLVPNLTYYPRACFLPPNTITDGSVAILTLRNGSRKIHKKDLEYYNSEEFTRFYKIARNYGTRSLNIDNNSVFFFGIMKDS